MKTSQRKVLSFKPLFSRKSGLKIYRVTLRVSYTLECFLTDALFLQNDALNLPKSSISFLSRFLHCF